MPKYLDEELELPVSAVLPTIQRRIMERTHWFGVKTLKNPMDFWVYQEIVHQMRPDVVVEIGNNWGGSTLALAHLLDLHGHGSVIGIDIDHSKIPEQVARHPRITLIEGDAVASYADVTRLLSADARVLVIEDSSHTFDNTLAVLRTYAALTRVGDYFIVEDTICHHGLPVGPAPGPTRQVERFVQEDARFEIDRDAESFFVTWNPKGFLRRVGS